jgi:transcriptional repressor NrdR
MICPNCGSPDKAEVKETRPGSDGGIRRRRRCKSCFHDFHTVEQVSSESLRVQKSDGQEQLFERAKLRRGIVKAAVRPHHVDRLTELVEAIAQAAHRQAHDGLITTGVLSEIVLDQLREFDEVTHVRYALTQVGRRDQSARGQRGWKRSSDFRAWLTEEYPRLNHSRPSVKLNLVVKRDDRREPYDRQKLERSVGLASKGRGRSDAEVRAFALKVADDAEEALSDQALVTSGQVSAEILRVLRDTDHIAAIRYASTAKRFSSVEDFETEALGLRGAKTL